VGDPRRGTAQLSIGTIQVVVANIAHLSGEMEPATAELLPALIAELDNADAEHTDVSITDESGWGLSAFATGLVIWENVEGDRDTEQQMTGVSRAEMVEMFTDIADGNLEAVAARSWVPRHD
jgi:hypothetical protein